jgi:hypothetical protein
MHPTLAIVLTQVLQYGSIAFSYADKMRALIWKSWLDYWYPAYPDGIRPHNRYFLSDTRQVTGLRVPENSIYVEEWVEKDIKRCIVRYADEEIPIQWTTTPFEKTPRTPWVWVGDRETEIDLTRTFNRFLVVGNRITKDLVKKLIQVTPKTRLVYIESGTFKELDFPGDGLTIEEYVDRPLRDRRPVHRTEEAVPTPVVGGRNDSAE